jgi:rubredoxin
VSGFENFGVRQDIGEETRMECGICWTVYDPSLGDLVAQIPPRTPFAALPEHWTCPNCDAAQSKFMMVESET